MHRRLAIQAWDLNLLLLFLLLLLLLLFDQWTVTKSIIKHLELEFISFDDLNVLVLHFLSPGEKGDDLLDLMDQA